MIKGELLYTNRCSRVSRNERLLFYHRSAVRVFSRARLEFRPEAKSRRFLFAGAS